MATISTPRNTFSRLLATNATSTTYATVAPVAITKMGVGSSSPVSGGNPVPPVAPNVNSAIIRSWDSYAAFVFFGTAAGSKVSNVKFSAIEPCGLNSWIYRDLLEVACTTGTAHGVALGTVLDTEYLVDTVAYVSGTSRYTIDGMGAASPLCLTLDPVGAAYILVQFKLATGGTAPTGFNGLFKTV